MAVKGNASKNYPNLGQYDKGLGKVAENHINNKGNPHGVTAEQIGAAKKEHVHDAIYETLVETTLEQLDTAEQAGFEGTVVGNTWQNRALGGLDIYVSGKVSFDVIENVNAKIFIDGNKLETDSFDGYVESKIYLYPAEMGSASLTFGTIKIAKYTGGIVSNEQANKLINTKVFTEAEKTKLKDTQSFTLAEKNAIARLDKITDAGYVLVDKTLVELQNEGKLIADTSVTTVNENLLKGGTQVTINVGGYVHFSARVTVTHKSVVMVDGKNIQTSSNYYLSYEGYADVIEIVDDDSIYIREVTVRLAEYNGGYMTDSHVKELEKATSRTESLEKDLKDVSAENEKQQTEIDSLKIETDGKYDKNESDTLLDAYSIELNKTVSLTGDELTDKTSDSIHLMSVTNKNAVTFGEEFEITSRYFGYIGVKKATVGVSYMLVAEIDIDTDFDMSKARVQGYYCPAGSSVATAEGIIVGTPQIGKNYILYPFVWTSDKSVRGFYFDAQIGNNPAVKLTLRDVRLYRQQVVQSDIDLTGLKEFECNIYRNGDLVKPKIGEYALVYDGTNLIASSLSGTTDADVVLYKPLDEVFANKAGTKASLNALEKRVTVAEKGLSEKADAVDLTALEEDVNAKGLTFMQYAANTKVPLEKGCLYYLRCNTDTIYYYRNGEKMSQYTEGFGDGLVMMAGNIFQGSHVNFLAAPASSGGLIPSFSMNGYTITTLDTDDVYAMSESDYINIWKLKA